MGKYVALIGEEYRMAINSLWAVLKHERFEPEELFLVFDCEKESSDRLKDDLKIILKNYDIDSSIELNNFSDIKDVRQLIMDQSSDQNDKIALDISAASKYTTAKLLMDKGSEFFDHIFYLKVDSEEKKIKPLSVIEKDRVKLLDLKSEHSGEI